MFPTTEIVRRIIPNQTSTNDQIFSSRLTESLDALHRSPAKEIVLIECKHVKEIVSRRDRIKQCYDASQNASQATLAFGAGSIACFVLNDFFSGDPLLNLGLCSLSVAIGTVIRNISRVIQFNQMIEDLAQYIFPIRVGTMSTPLPSLPAPPHSTSSHGWSDGEFAKLKFQREGSLEALNLWKE